MYRDEILAEVWRNRDAYVAEHGHSLDEIVSDLRRRQEQHRDRLIDRRSPSTQTPESREPVTTER